MEIRKEDVDILDKMLKCIVEDDNNRIKGKSYFINLEILPKKIADNEYSNYVGILSSCGVKLNNGFGNDKYSLSSSEEAVNFFTNGGFKMLYKTLEKEKRIRIEKEKKEIENLEWQIKVNKWLYRTKWLPHIFSGIAVIISIVALIFEFQKKK